MKSINYFLIIIFIGLISCQQTNATSVAPLLTKKYSNEEIQSKIASYKSSDDVDTSPSNILSQKFSKDFPDSRDISWEVAANIYKVDFEIGRTDYEAYYDTDGELLMYSCELRSSELPAIVKNAVIAKYPDYNFKDIKKICQDYEIFYKVELERNRNDITVTIDSKGTIINQYLD